MKSSCLSKDPSRYPDRYPRAIDSAAGAYLHSGGSVWVDLVMGLAAVGLFGHSPKHIRQLGWALDGGTNFHLPSRYERYTAEMLLRAIDKPWAQSVRWALNGTDVTAGAVRLARAVTGRDPVIVFSGAYHGESTGDWSAAGKPPARGIPRGNLAPVTCKWNDPEFPGAYTLGPAAAIIFEVGLEDPTPEFIVGLQRYRDEYGCLLIADEVVTGFRLAMGGACERYGITPDLACYAKALGSGIPVAALVGREELMREFDPAHTSEPVFMSFSHAGNVLALTAAEATLFALMERPGIFAEVESIGRQLMDALTSRAASHDINQYVYAAGQPARHCWKFRDAGVVTARDLLALFQQKMCEQRVLAGVTNCPTICHGALEMGMITAALDHTLCSVKQAIADQDITRHLVGPTPRALYVRPS